MITHFSGEYIHEHYLNLRESETLKSVRSDYMKCQPWICAEMRSVLVQWMAEIVNWFNLSDKTFFVSVSLVDRFLSKRTCKKNSLQLVAITAIYVASKLEEIFELTTVNCAAFVDGSFPSDVAQMELILLISLNYRICCVTVSDYFELFLFVDTGTILTDNKIFNDAIQIAEIGLIVQTIGEMAPSIVACACWIFARNKNNINPPWPENLINFTNIIASDVKICLKTLKETYNHVSLMEKSPVILTKPRKY